MEKVKIVIDAFRLVLEPFTSGAIYLNEMVKFCVKDDRFEKIYLAVPRFSRDEFVFGEILRNFKIILVEIDSKVSPIDSFRSQLLWIHFVIPKAIRHLDFNCFLAPYHHPPIHLSKNVKKITIIHDICGIGKDYPKNKKGFYRHLIMLVVSSLFSDSIIPISLYTKHEYAKKFFWSKYKVTEPVLNGVDFLSLSKEEALDNLKHLPIPASYHLCFGMPGTRKGFDLTMRAFSEYQHTSKTYLIVVTPSSLRNDIEIMLTNSMIRNYIILSTLSREELNSLYSLANSLIFPSRCEGFGYPVLESMRQGTPVIAGNIGPAVEILGNTIDLIDLNDIGSIIKEMQKWDSISILEKQTISERLIDRSKLFSGDSFGLKISNTIAEERLR